MCPESYRRSDARLPSALAACNAHGTFRYDGQNCLNTWAFNPGHEHDFSDNVCVMLFDQYYASVSACDGAHLAGSRCESKEGPTEQCMCHVSANSYYSPFGNASMKCDGDADVPLGSLQEAGIEAGSTVGLLPSNAQIVQWAREALRWEQGVAAA